MLNKGDSLECRVTLGMVGIKMNVEGLVKFVMRWFLSIILEVRDGERPD